MKIRCGVADDGTDEGVCANLAVGAHLLKLVEGKVALLSGFLHVLKDLLQSLPSILRHHIEAERRLAADGVWRHRWTQRSYEAAELPPDRLRRCVKPAHDGICHELHHLAERLRWEDVNVEALHMLVLCLHSLEGMVYQACLSYATRRHQHHVAAISQSLCQCLCLLLPVAEVLRAEVTVFRKRVL